MGNRTDRGVTGTFDGEDSRYMRRALALARRGLGLASPNPTVGCVIVKEESVVGHGLHEYALKHHAEVWALKEAAERARRSTVYVTLEPCSHYGRTPPCADLLVRAGVRRVVVAAVDPNPQVSGKGIDVLRSHGIRVDVGLMEDEALSLIEPFACRMTAGRPLVVAKAGMSLDGRIATRAGKARWITSPEGREFGQSLRLQCDALLAGIGTILADDPELSYRGGLPKSRPLTRVLLDSRLRTPPGARVLQSRDPVIIFCRSDAPERRRRKLEGRGAAIVSVRHEGGLLDLRQVLAELAAREILGVLVEGGGEIHWSFLVQGLVDKFYFIIAPLVLGGRDAIPVVGGAGYETVQEALSFIIRRSFKAGRDLVLEAYPPESRSILSPWRASTAAPSHVRGQDISSRRK